MNAAILMAGLLAAGGTTADEWADAPRVQLQGKVLVVQSADAQKRAELQPLKLYEVPKSPPLAAQKKPDGSIKLEHKSRRQSEQEESQ